MSSKSKRKRAGRNQRARSPVADGAASINDPGEGVDRLSHGSAAGKPAKVSRALIERFPESGIELTAENLPVLNAFNEFLAIERQASRRRFRGLFWLFLLLLIAALTSALMVGWVVVEKMQADLDAERELAEVERQRMTETISRVATNAADRLHRELGVRDQAVRYTYRTLTDHIAGQTNTALELRQTMAILEDEIDALEDRMRELALRERSAHPIAPYIRIDSPTPALDSELERQIERDFSELRRWARIQQERLEAKAEADDIPETQPDREHEVAIPSSPLTIETPVGESVPWRL